MSSKVPLSDAVLRAVDRSFADADRSRVRDALSSIESQWTREALLILANGDVGRFFELVDWHNYDWREIPARLQGSDDGISEEELIRRREALGLSLVRGRCEAHFEDVQKRVLDFVAAKLLWPVARLNGEIRLQGDLGLAGSDGAKFMAVFGAKFQVDMSAFKPEHHFAAKPGEGSFWGLLARLCMRKVPSIIQITIDDLIRAADERRWKVSGAS
jgi:hypothetical protein